MPLPRVPLAVAAALLAATLAAPSGAGELRVRTHAPSRGPIGPPLPAYPVQLVSDDGSSDGSVGVGAPAEQFLWFQAFASPGGPFHLEEVWVLFDDDDVVDVGDPIELVIYHDPDGDPTNGATLLAALDATIQDLSGAQFSVYPLPMPPLVPAGGEVYVGVVNRFVTSGVTPDNQPAVFDLSGPAGNAWLATWAGDPPDPPTLPADGSMQVLSGALAGSWMIRAFGTPVPPPPAEVPAASTLGLALLALLLALAGRRALGG